MKAILYWVKVVAWKFDPNTEEEEIEGWIFCKLFTEADETWQYLAL